MREEAFYFFTSIGNYTGLSASSLEEFLGMIKDVDVKSLEFHLFREDFEKWISQTLGDNRLADDIKTLRVQKVAGNTLRDRLYFMVSRRLKELKGTTLESKSVLVSEPKGSSASELKSASTSEPKSPTTSELKTASTTK